MKNLYCILDYNLFVCSFFRSWQTYFTIIKYFTSNILIKRIFYKTFSFVNNFIYLLVFCRIIVHRIPGGHYVVYYIANYIVRNKIAVVTCNYNLMDIHVLTGEVQYLAFFDHSALRSIGSRSIIVCFALREQSIIVFTCVASNKLLFFKVSK
jgi:hypothetical protein